MDNRTPESPFTILPEHAVTKGVTLSPLPGRTDIGLLDVQQQAQTKEDIESVLGAIQGMLGEQENLHLIVDTRNMRGNPNFVALFQAIKPLLDSGMLGKDSKISMSWIVNNKIMGMVAEGLNSRGFGNINVPVYSDVETALEAKLQLEAGNR